MSIRYLKNWVFRHWKAPDSFVLIQKQLKDKKISSVLFQSEMTFEKELSGVDRS